MSGDSFLLVIGVVGSLLIAIFIWRRFDVNELAVTRPLEGPDEPCWTQELGSDGRYRYGRHGCVNDELMEMERRARRGEFDTPV